MHRGQHYLFYDLSQPRHEPRILVQLAKCIRVFTAGDCADCGIDDHENIDMGGQNAT